MSVHGEVDIATAPTLERETHAALASGNDQLVLDLSGTTLLALAGIRVTERLAYAASERDGQLVLVARTPAVRRILGLVPHPWMRVTENVGAALAVLAEPPVAAGRR